MLISTDAALEIGGPIKLDVPDLGLLEATVLHSRDQQYGLAFASSPEERAELAEKLDKIFAARGEARSNEISEEIVDEQPDEPADEQPADDVQQTPAVCADETHRAARSVTVSREAIQTAEMPVEFTNTGHNLVAQEGGAHRPRGTVITVANPKGGSGKSTISMHLVSGLMRFGFTVATADLDPEQETLTRYLENRAAFAAEEGLELPSPVRHSRFRSHVDDAVERELRHLTDIANVVVIDTAARISSLSQVAHALADILITPINDSFVDLDVLATIDPRTLEFRGASTYGQFITDIRAKKAEGGLGDIDWVVMRNRLTSLDARNKRDMAEAVADLAGRLGFTVGSGLSERVIYRELFLHGLSLLDLRATGKPLTLSHVVARQELRSLLSGILPKIALVECARVA
jgi:chromosome partitioning protein